MSGESNDDVRKEYDELKDRFRHTTPDEFKSGSWFLDLVRWLLEHYAKTVDAEYIRRAYPGASSADQAKKAIKLAARHNAMAGAVAASAITALELSSIGPQALVTVPAAFALVGADIAFSTRTQLRTTYDLSVIHGAPLRVDDVEDCYLILLTAIGVKIQEVIGGIGKTFGPQVIKYNVRKLLRTGLRRTLQEGLKRVGGVRLAKLLTERALLRFVVPGISIPIAYGFNGYFTRQVLEAANRLMLRRAAIVQPLVRLLKVEPELAKTVGPKVLIVTANAGNKEEWTESQMDALRHCQACLALTDGELAELDAYFDRGIGDLLNELPQVISNGGQHIFELALVQAAFAGNNQQDAQYGEVLVRFAERCLLRVDAAEALRRLAERRRRGS